MQNSLFHEEDARSNNPKVSLLLFSYQIRPKYKWKDMVWKAISYEATNEK